MKKVLSFIITILGIIAIMFSLSFLYIKGYFDGLINMITNNSSSQIVNSPNPNGMKYISERTFSMRFRSKNEVGFGTGWLFAKDESAGNNGLTYYVATNLHVASFIQNNNKSYYTYDSKSNKYVEGSNTSFEAVDIGQIGSWEGNTFIPGTDKAKLGSESTKYYEYFNLSNNVSASPVTIAYETFNMFKDKNIESYNKVYGENYVQNGTLDLAILKMDFSRIKQINSLNNSILNKLSPIKDTLRVFDANPTKFAKDFNSKKDVITVGGFPATQNIAGPTSYWNSASNTLLKETKDGSIAIGNHDWKNGISETNNETIKKKYALPNQIAYVTNEYASYLNVAKQNLFYNMDLSGGSSGSMAVNQNNEVIGIYWGTYSFSDGKSYGVVDSFKNDKTTNNIVAYNFYNDFKTRIPTTSLSKMDI